MRALREDVEGKVGPVVPPQPVAVRWAESPLPRAGRHLSGREEGEEGEEGAYVRGFRGAGVHALRCCSPLSSNFAIRCICVCSNLLLPTACPAAPRLLPWRARARARVLQRVSSKTDLARRTPARARVTTTNTNSLTIPLLTHTPLRILIISVCAGSVASTAQRRGRGSRGSTTTTTLGRAKG